MSQRVAHWLLVVAALSCAGCNDLHGVLCEAAAKCGSGGDEEIDACIAKLDGEAEVAAIYGCDDLWDDFVTCMDETATCDDQELRGCGVENDRYESCIDTAEHGEAKVKGKDPDKG